MCETDLERVCVRVSVCVDDRDRVCDAVARGVAVVDLDDAGVLDCVAVSDAVCVDVRVPVIVRVIVGVSDAVCVDVREPVPVCVHIGVSDDVGVDVRVTVPVCVIVGVSDAVGVDVRVPVPVRVIVGVSDDVGVPDDVGRSQVPAGHTVQFPPASTAQHSSYAASPPVLKLDGTQSPLPSQKLAKIPYVAVMRKPGAQFRHVESGAQPLSHASVLQPTHAADEQNTGVPETDADSDPDGDADGEADVDGDAPTERLADGDGDVEAMTPPHVPAGHVVQ